jgi:Protein of unknown function (DUF3592)
LTAETVFGLLILLAGGLNLVYAGRVAFRSWRARRWSAVDGELLSADLKKGKNLPAHGAWRLRVAYRYSFGAKTYTGAVISPDGGPSFFNEALGRLALASQWRAGMAVKVRVNPRHPEDAMLVLRVSAATLLMLMVGIGLTAGGLARLLSP